MERSLLFANPLPERDGYTWTLASRLGNMLVAAEAWLGTRDLSYTILGVEFSPDGPQIWYPGNRRQIVIQLSEGAIHNTVVAAYQLAHECVHLLAPHPGRPASVLEEGLAVTFSRVHLIETLGATCATGDERYDQAAAIVQRALGHNQVFPRRLRDLHGRFSDIQASDIKEIASEIPDTLCDELAAPFPRRES